MTTDTVLTEIEMANICQGYAPSEALAMGRAIERASAQQAVATMVQGK